MKNILLFTAIILIVISCKKNTKDPEGPTDVRIRNITTANMTNVTVNTYDSTFNFGTVNATSVSDYHRFDRAYPKANISVIINNQKYKTDTLTSYAYMQYMSTMKITYEIWIENESLKKLAIFRVITEAPLK